MPHTLILTYAYKTQDSVPQRAAPHRNACSLNEPLVYLCSFGLLKVHETKRSAGRPVLDTQVNGRQRICKYRQRQFLAAT